MYGHMNDAISVVRLVLRHSPRPTPPSTAQRHFSAVLPLPSREPPFSQQSENLYFSSTSTNTVADASPPDFLEIPSSEYSKAVRNLPYRRHHPQPIPWPTLFPLHASPKPPLQDPCEPLHQLVRSDNYTSALAVLHELKAHKIHIMVKDIYLQPAIACLYATPMDQAGFWEWLSFYPPRPATANHDALKEQWSPVLKRLLWCHPNNPRLLVRFLCWSAERGLLPTTFIPLMHHLTYRLRPHESLRVFRKAIDLYHTHATSSTSTTERARYHKGIVDEQVDGWWNRYVRYLLAAGWKEEGLKFYQVMGENRKGGSWDDVTEALVKGKMTGVYEIAQARGIRKLGPSEQVQRGGSNHQNEIEAPQPTAEERQTRASGPLTTKTILSLRRGKTTASHLAKTLHELLTHSPPRLTLYNRLRDLYLSHTEVQHATQHFRILLWHHAEVIRLTQHGQCEEAISYFQKHFTWIGIPHHHLKITPAISMTDTTRERTDTQYPLAPKIHIITTLLRSLLHTLPNPARDIPNYLRSHINLVSSLPPALRPTSVTSSVYIREITRHVGGNAGVGYLAELEAAGWETPNQPDALWGVVKALAHQGRYEEMRRLWKRMEENGVIRDQARRVLVEILMEQGELGLAGDILGQQAEEAEVPVERVAATA